MPIKGRIFVVSAPSGSGKTTLCRKLIRSLSGRRKLLRSVSVTTRKPRKGERAGRDYSFISKQQFLERRRRQGFLEWAGVLSNYYGTPREFVERETKRGNDVLLSIDVQGARKIRRLNPEAVLIFILPPSRLVSVAARFRCLQGVGISAFTVDQRRFIEDHYSKKILF